MSAPFQSTAFRWLPYQVRYLHDWSPRINVVKTRRAGLSEVTAFKGSERAAGVRLFFDGRPPVTGLPPVQQNVFSASKRQAVDLLERYVPHLRVLEMAHPRGKLIADIGKEVITLTNGIKLKAFSTNSATMRGEWGDVNADEFANVMRQEKVWKGMEAIASATPRNPHGYHITVTSTPLGDDNLHYRISEGDLAKRFSQHRITMAQAMAEGFVLLDDDGQPITLEEFFASKGDPDLVAQEYMCSFLSASSRYIDRELWEAATYDGSREVRLADGSPGIIYGGMDVGAGGHESTIAELEKHGETMWQVLPVERRRERDWSKQEEWAAAGMQRRARFAIDATGIGDQFGQGMESRFPGVVESVKFTLQSKEAIATGLKLGLSRKRLRPLAEDTELMRDVLSLRRTITSVGNVRYDAENTKTRHADGAWALGLAAYAAGGSAVQGLSNYRRGIAPKPLGIVGDEPEKRRGGKRFGQMW